MMHLEDRTKGAADRVPAMFDDGTAIKVQFGKENANRIAGVRRRTARVSHHSMRGRNP